MSKVTTSRDKCVEIIALVKAGHDLAFIAQQTGVRLRTVQRIVKRFRDTGEASVPAPLPKPGRPRLTSARTRSVIARQVNKDPKLTARELKEKNPKLLGNVSLRSVQQLLHDDLGYKSYRARKKPLLTELQKAKRVRFCKKYLNWSEEDWKTVLWSDEASFTVTGTPSHRVYRKPGSDALDPKYMTKFVKHPASLMVWGCFTYHGVGDLVVLPANEKVNQYNYLELLCDVLCNSFDKTKAQVFMQDSAPAHIAKSVTKWLGDCEVSYIRDWPGNSPDINPIENLLSHMKKQLRSMDTSSVPKLEAAIKKLWASFSPSVLQNLATSVPKRLKEIIKRKGNATKY